MRRSTGSKLGLATLLTTTATFALGAGAHAQATTDQTGQLAGRDAPAANANQVGEVIVTAQKREERLLDTPVPVTALQPQTLQRTGAVTFEDYLARVPGFAAISVREGATQLILRGITTGPQPNTTVGVYVDDTPFGSSSVFTSGGTLTPDIDPSDLQRIEVLRGPQGTLYGANTLGGLLKFVTAQPDTTAYHGRIEADGDTVDHGGDGYGVRGMINLPLIKDKLALRVSAFDRDDPGFIDDPLLGRRDVDSTRVYGGRVSVLWNATDKLSVQLTATSENLKGRGSPSEDVNYMTLAPLYGRYVQDRSIREVLDNRYRVYNGRVSYDLGFADLISSTSYNTLFASRNVDVTTALGGAVGGALGIANFGLNEPAPVHQTRFTEEARLTSHPGLKVVGLPIDYQVGFYFDHERGNQNQSFDPFNTVTGAPIALPTLAVVTLRSRYSEYAGFGDVTVHFTPSFDIAGGVRYSSNNQHYTQTVGGLLEGNPVYPASRSSDSSTTFLVTPEYKINRDNLLYVRIASGYRPGGPNALPPTQIAAGVPTSFKPDTLVNYEVGYKTSLLDHRLTLDLSAFYIDWSDVQLLTRVQTFTVEGNGGSAVSKGIEGALTYTPIHGLTFSDNFAYTDARLTTDAPAAGGVDRDRLPYVPTWSDNFNVDYDWTVVSGWNAYVGASYRFIGDRTSAFAVSGLPTFVRPTIPSYEVIDLRAGLTYKQYALNLYLKNVQDSRGITDLAGLAVDPGLNPYSASLIQPRTFGIAVSAQF